MQHDQKMREVNRTLARSNKEISFAVKSKMAELMINLTRRRKRFGMFVILGWKAKWQLYADTPDASQDIFARHRVNIMDITPAERKKDSIVTTVDFDGAILIDRRGNILHSGVMIEGLRPRATAKKLNPRSAGDLSSRFGFRRKVHMRHIAAITSSYLFKGTTIFTISEETNDFHIFENGRIVYSTISREGQRSRN
jgi:DNA integrity scanning protein DisA with diadenylate cyclase activity